VIWVAVKAEGRGQKAEGQRRKSSETLMAQGLSNFCLLPFALKPVPLLILRG